MLGYNPFMSKLTLIGTPLGNIEDISLRQLRALFSFDVILAEDTRSYIKLRNLLAERFSGILENLELNTEHRPELISYREQNHNKVLPKILELIKTEKSIGLITDAGMPTISDPGYKLVDEVLNSGLEVDVIPGSTAIETALSISGLPTDRFLFLGFLPRTKSKIQKLLPLNREDSKYKLPTIIVYESPFRVIKTLEIIAEIYPEAKVAACNDLTKKFQKVIRGNISEVTSELKKMKVQGEWVLVINPQS